MEPYLVDNGRLPRAWGALPHRDSPLLHSSRPPPGTLGVLMGTFTPRLHTFAAPSSTGSRTSASAALATGAPAASGSTRAAGLLDATACLPSGQPLPNLGRQRKPFPLRGVCGGHPLRLVRSPWVAITRIRPAVWAAAPASAAPFVSAPWSSSGPAAAAAAFLAPVPAWVPALVSALVAPPVSAPVSAPTACAARDRVLLECAISLLRPACC